MVPIESTPSPVSGPRSTVVVVVGSEVASSPEQAAATRASSTTSARTDRMPDSYTGMARPLRR